MRIKRSAKDPAPTVNPNRAGVIAELIAEVTGVSKTIRWSLTVCSVAFLLRKGEVQMKYLKRSSN